MLVFAYMLKNVGSRLLIVSSLILPFPYVRVNHRTWHSRIFGVYAGSPAVSFFRVQVANPQVLTWEPTKEVQMIFRETGFLAVA